jgi:hypothetical protein
MILADDMKALLPDSVNMRGASKRSDCVCVCVICTEAVGSWTELHHSQLLQATHRSVYQDGNGHWKGRAHSISRAVTCLFCIFCQKRVLRLLSSSRQKFSIKRES